MQGERMVAGLRCSEVLADLSDYLDAALPAERVEQIEQHLRGCDYCERFGREFSAAVRTLRHGLSAADPLHPDVAARLRERLKRERG